MRRDDSAGPLDELAHKQEEARGKAERKRTAAKTPADLQLDDFYAYMLEHKYIFTPAGQVWPAASVNGPLQAGRRRRR